MRDARHKSWLIRAGALAERRSCAGVLGYLAAGTPWMLLPVAGADQPQHWARCGG